jgi:hypothetical protein
MPPRPSLYPLHLSVAFFYFPSKATNYEINIHIRITLDHAPTFGETLASPKYYKLIDHQACTFMQIPK